MTFDNTEQYIQEQIKRIDKFAKGQNSSFYTVVGTTHGLLVKRIFEDGKDANAADLPRYETKSTNIRGKRYSGGYAEFKRQRSKSSASQRGVYDLTLDGATRREFSVTKGFNEGGWEYSITENIEKIRGQKKLKGKTVFALSDEESKEHARKIELALIRDLNG
jgi:hypothetical protein